MQNNIVFYFSGTGNSLKAAKDIAAKLKNCELVSMAKPYTPTVGYERIGFVFPCYARGLPLAVVKFIESLDLSHNLDTYFFAVPTCGGKPGNCIAQINELLKAKRLSLSYGKMIKMFANAITYYKMADNPQERADESNTEIAVIAAQIAKKKRSDIPKANALLKLLYTKMTAGYPLKAQNFNVSNACIGCGNCEKICPVENVSVHNGKPIFGEQCEQCMACIQWCPARAIDYKNKTQDSARYHHPEISFAEMAREND